MLLLLTGAATLSYLILLALLTTLNQSDAAGNGLTYSYAMLVAFALWGLVALLTIVAMRAGGTPAWVKGAAVVLLPLGLAATTTTIGLLRGRGGASGWPIVVPAVVPALIIAYGAWLSIPALHARLSADVAHRMVWGTVLVLSIVPFPLQRARRGREETTQAEREAAGRAREDAERRELEARLDSLTPDRPLRDWLAFAAAGHDLRERTLERIRELPGRQREAETMMGDDRALLMSELRNLGLEATPALCRSANDFLVQHAESFRSRAATTARYEIEGASIERYLFAMQWLAANGCEVGPAADAYGDVVRLYPAAPDREQFLARLASFRAPAR
jgi:hypothetical protein